MVKTAIVTHVLPPTWSGQAMMLERLLQPLDSSAYVLISTMAPSTEPAFGPSLPGPVFSVHDGPASHSRGLLGKSRVSRGLRALRARSRRIAEIVEEEGCDTIVGCTGGDGLDIPAAWRASRRVGTRFVPYYFDYWPQQLSDPTERRMAGWMERLILRKGSSVIVTNEFLAVELQELYGVSCTIVRNACVVSMGDDTASTRVRDPNAPLSIVYTGAVYEANFDAFRNLVTAVNLSDFDVKVRIYTAQSEEALSAHGIRGPVEVHGHRTVGEARALQREADVLFLPLAFTSPYPKIIRTSSPAKMCEYLSSGTPILVHAPPNTFVAEYFREHGCGVVVDDPDPVLLAGAVRQLLEDERLRTSVTKAALSCARADYDLNAAQETFAATVGF